MKTQTRHHEPCPSCGHPMHRTAMRSTTVSYRWNCDACGWVSKRYVVTPKLHRAVVSQADIPVIAGVRMVYSSEKGV